MNQSKNQPDTLLRWMGGLADPNRLRVLRLLDRHELGVAELCDVLQMPQSSVSRHLKLLADDGWVTSRRQGTTNFYCMDTQGLGPAADQLWQLARQQTESWATLGQDRVRLARRLRERQTRSQAFFADAADDWDRIRETQYGPSLGCEAMLGLLPRQWTVADLGCGTGAQTAELARFVHRVIAVDNSGPMLDAARQRTADLPGVEVREGNLEALPIDDQACDAAMLVLVLAYLPEPAAVLSEMRRVLKPGGRAVVIDLLRHDRDDFRRQMGQQCMGFDPDEMNGLLEGAGFTEPRTESLPPDPKARGPALLLTTAQASGDVPRFAHIPAAKPIAAAHD